MNQTKCLSPRRKTPGGNIRVELNAQMIAAEKRVEETEQKATAASLCRDAAVGISTKMWIRAWFAAEAEPVPWEQPWVVHSAVLLGRP